MNYPDILFSELVIGRMNERIAEPIAINPVKITTPWNWCSAYIPPAIIGEIAATTPVPVKIRAVMWMLRCY